MGEFHRWGVLRLPNSEEGSADAVQEPPSGRSSIVAEVKLAGRVGGGGGGVP